MRLSAVTVAGSGQPHTLVLPLPIHIHEALRICGWLRILRKCTHWIALPGSVPEPDTQVK